MEKNSKVDSLITFDYQDTRALVKHEQAAKNDVNVYVEPKLFLKMLYLARQSASANSSAIAWIATPENLKKSEKWG